MPAYPEARPVRQRPELCQSQEVRSVQCVSRRSLAFCLVTPEFLTKHARLAPQQSGCCIDAHLVAVAILLPAWDDREGNLLSVRQLGDASQGCHHQLLLVLQLGSILQALQAAPPAGAKVLAAGLCRVVMRAQGALLHCCGMACTAVARSGAQQYPGPAKYTCHDGLALADAEHLILACRWLPLAAGAGLNEHNTLKQAGNASPRRGARRHGMSALACLHAGNLCQQELPRQCALAEDDHAAVMPADTLRHKPGSVTSWYASVLECLMWRTWPSIERPVHCSCTDCLTVSLAFCSGSLPCLGETLHARQCRSWPGLCLLADLRPLSCCTCNVSSLPCIQHQSVQT